MSTLSSIKRYFWWWNAYFELLIHIASSVCSIH